jgi:hypothetical protein
LNAEGRRLFTAKLAEAIHGRFCPALPDKSAANLK